MQKLSKEWITYLVFFSLINISMFWTEEKQKWAI